MITSLSMGNFTKSEPGTKRPNLSTDQNCFPVLAQLGIEVSQRVKNMHEFVTDFVTHVCHIRSIPVL